MFCYSLSSWKCFIKSWFAHPLIRYPFLWLAVCPAGFDSGAPAARPGDLQAQLQGRRRGEGRRPRLGLRVGRRCDLFTVFYEGIKLSHTVNCSFCQLFYIRLLNKSFIFFLIYQPTKNFCLSGFAEEEEGDTFTGNGDVANGAAARKVRV